MNCRKTFLNKSIGNKVISAFVYFFIFGYFLYVFFLLRCNVVEIDKVCKFYLYYYCLFYFNFVKMNYEMFREFFFMFKGVFYKCLIFFIYLDKKKFNVENNRNIC